MRVKSWQCFFLIIVFFGQIAAQNKVSGLVDGETWSLDQSPIHVSGDLNVLQLTIEPGVRVLFDGNYRMTVSGLLRAQGTEQDSIIFEASASNTGGWAGIYFDQADANSTLQYCRISGVVTNPALEITGNSLNLSHTVVSQNQALGIRINNSQVSMERCTVQNNGQRGLHIENNGKLTATACKILNNASTGVETNSGQLTLTNSIVAFNQEEGVVLSGTGDILTCTNSVLSYNNKEGVINVGGTHHILNSIIYFNSAAQQVVKIGGAGDINYSDIAQSGLGGNGNIMQDPLFANTVDFTLAPNSPAIDAGDPASSYNDRYFPPSKGTQRNDMGAFGGPLARKWFPPVFPTPDSLDFGKVSLGDSLTLHLTLKNYSDEVLNIAQIVLFGQDAQNFSLTETYQDIQLAMADSLLIPVRFRPLQTSSLPYEASLVIASDLGEKSIPLKGTVVTANIFTLSDELQFGAVSVTEADSQEFNLFNTGTDTLRIDSIRFTGAAFSATLSQTKLPPYSENPLPLIVFFKPDTMGLITDTLRIFSNDPDDSPLLISVSGTGLAPLMRVEPFALQFDSLQVYRDSTLSVVIRNFGNQTLQVTDMHFSSTAGPFSVEFDQTLEIGPQTNSAPIAVHFTPDTTALFVDTLLIVSDDPFQPEARLAASGTGIGAFLQLPVSTLDFGQLAMPGDSLLKLTIKNSGNIDLGVQSIKIAGRDVPSFNWWKVSGDMKIAPNSDSLQIYVRCVPQKSGPLQAFLEIASNDAQNPVFKLPLAAFVTAAELVLQPDTVRFDSIMIFDQQTVTVKLFNRGDNQLQINSITVEADSNHNFSWNLPPAPLILQPKSDTLQFPVSFHPLRVGSQQALVRFYSNDPFRNPRSLLITARAVEAKLALTSDTLDFGRASLFRQQTRSLLLQNTGDATVIIDSVVISDTTVFTLADSWPQSIAAHSGDVPLNIQFTPPDTGHFESELTIYWNNPYKQPSRAHLIAEADSARLLVNERLNFGKQVVNTTTEREITITNQSHVLVYVDSLRMTGPAADLFSVEERTFPLVLNPQDSVLRFKVTYHPLKSGLHQAQLRLYSRDIEHGILTTEISAIALHSSNAPLLVCNLPDQLHFGSEFIDESRFVPFYIANLGNSPLLIDSLRIDSTTAGIFAIVPPLSNTTIQMDDTLSDLQIQFTPQAATDYSARLTIYSNDPERASFQVKLSGSGKIDPTPANVSLNLDTLQFIYGQQGLFSVAISDDSTQINQALLFIRPGASQQFQQIALETDAQQRWSASLPANLLTERGLEMYLQIHHGGRITRYPEDGEQNPLYLPVTLPEVLYPYQTLKEKYQMISLPFNSDQTLSELFSDDLGNYNPEIYRIFDWNNQALQFEEQSDLKTVLKPGKALFLITRDSLSLDVQNVQSVATTRNFNIPLHNGWNMIANPFPFTISWDEVTRDWSEKPILYFYTGSGWTMSNILKPFKGYAVKISDKNSLEIPPLPLQSTMAKTALSTNVAWKIQLKARSGPFQDLFNFAGATLNDQARTAPEPPTIGSFVALYFRAKDGERQALDLRPAHKQGYTFDFVVEWNTGKSASLSIEPDSLPRGWRWELVSLDRRLNLGFEPHVTLQQSGANLRLIVGTQAFVTSQTQNFLPVPRVFKLTQNFPNPFNQDTRIRFQLPQDDRLTIEIFDIQGRKVKALAHNRPYAPGYYELLWHGENNQNRTVASGLYFLRLKGKKFSGLRKLILQK